MKIVHYISSTDLKSGGTTAYLKGLADELIKHHVLRILSHPSATPIKFSESENLFVELLPKRGVFKISDFRKTLDQIRPDIIHINGLWELSTVFFQRDSCRYKVPVVLSTHGMLSPWALNHKKIIKQVAMVLYQKECLRQATCLHATSAMEASDIRRLGFTNPIAVIPNGIELKDFALSGIEKNIKGRRKVLFLSRIHPVKGLDVLIDAWSFLDQSIRINWCLEIVGNGEAAYISILQDSIKTKKLEDEIFIQNPKYGHEKIQAFHDASLFVLPSFTENFGIVVAEALACGTPAIATKSAPWHDLEAYRCGWWINNGVAPLREALQQAMVIAPDDLQEMGIRGRQLVEGKYSSASVSERMVQLYEWLLGRREKPEFVVLASD